MFGYKFNETNVENEHLEQGLQEALMDKSVSDSEGMDDDFDRFDTEGQAPGDSVFNSSLTCQGAMASVLCRAMKDLGN